MGIRLMSATVAAVCGVVLAGVAAAQGLTTSHPIVGAWKLNPAKSTVGLTVTFTAAADGTMTMAWVAEKYSFRVDGKEYPAPSGASAAWTQKSPREWETVYRVQGKVDNVDRLSLSADGKTLTISTDRVVTKSKEELVLARTAGGPGLPGVWRTVRAAIDSTAEYSVANGRLTARIEPSGERWTGPLDGKDYAVTSAPTLPPGVTWAGQQAGPRAIKFVLKIKGTPVQFATLTVSPDGKTLEIVQINGATETATDRNRLIFERR
jgi:hypothetical protein